MNEGLCSACLNRPAADSTDYHIGSATVPTARAQPSTAFKIPSELAAFPQVQTARAAPVPPRGSPEAVIMGAAHPTALRRELYIVAGILR